MSKALFLLLLLLCSCGFQEQRSNESDTLYLCTGSDPFSFDPRVAGDRNSQSILRFVFEGLTRIEPDGKPHPAIAESIVVSEDKKTYTFYLRKSYWSNGEPLTAHHFERSWKKTISKDFASKYRYAFHIIKNAKAYAENHCSLDEIKIHAESDQVLVVELENPAPYFLELVANPIYSPVHHSMNTKKIEWSVSSDYISNGPFKIKHWRFKDEISLHKNHLYWNSRKVPLDKIMISILSDSYTSFLLFQRGEIDWMGDPLCGIPTDCLPFLKKEKLLHIRPPTTVYMYMCNKKAFPLNNAKIRKALALSIDRKDIVDYLLEGNEIPAYSILPPFLSLQEKEAFKDHDIQKARELLSEALMELKIEKKDLPTIYITHSYPDKRIPQVIQQQWKKGLEIDVRIENIDWHSCLKKLMDNNFQLLGLYWESWISDPIYNLRYNSIFKNDVDHKIEGLLAQSDAEKDLYKRNFYLEQAEYQLIDDMHIIPIYFRTDLCIKKDYVKGVYFTPLGNPDFTYAHLEFKKDTEK